MDVRDHQLIDRFKTLLGERIGVSFEVILFGSRARGDADDESDMDILVIVDQARTPELRQTVSQCAWEAGFDSGVVISAVLVSREDWEHGPQRESLLARAIAREGVVV